MLQTAPRFNRWSPDYQYKTGRVKAGMESNSVWSYRDGQSVSKPW
ncbi:MAG TPA: hypothetical protein VEL51_03715 [Vicinamibacterales bacterium]|nr:hypothetical protein [Vicinamibacterales bacterium]